MGAPTRYAELSRAGAAIVLALFVVLEAWFLATALRAPAVPATPTAAPHRDGDVAFYKTVVARVRAGEGYYDVLDVEQRRQGYPVRPAFNWRQPTYAWLLCRLPSPIVGNAALVLIGIGFVAAVRRWVGASATRARLGLVTALVVVSVSIALVGDFVYLQESWAGALVALSIALSALDRWPAAVAAGLGALAFRELAIGPVLVGLALALRRRRGAEAAAWGIGLAAYAVLFSWHLAEVTRHLRPDDVARGWVARGGAAFLLATWKWSPLFVALPDSVAAATIPIVLLGLAGWRDEGALRATLVVFGYLAVFTVIGNPFNDYWGAVYAPLLPLGFVALPDCARDLARALRASPRSA